MKQLLVHWDLDQQIPSCTCDLLYPKVKQLEQQVKVLSLVANDQIELGFFLRSSFSWFLYDHYVVSILLLLLPLELIDQILDAIWLE